jgi:hypothetical protein
MHHTLEQLNFTHIQFHPIDEPLALAYLVILTQTFSRLQHIDIIKIMSNSKEMYISSAKHDMGSKEMPLN